MNFLAVLSVCLLPGYILTADALKCQSPQYVIIGEKGVVECEFPKQFTGIVWYDSTNTSEAKVTRLEKQENGALEVSGNGYDSGYYDMFSNGSLIIPSVSVYYDRTYKVVLIDEVYNVENADILVMTIVYPGQSSPLIESCGEENFCLVNPKETDFLQCKYSHARPPVLLSWYKNYEGKDKIIDAQLTTTSDGQYTFESILRANVSSLVQASFNMFTCEASGPALDFKESTTTVLTFDLDQRQSTANRSKTVLNVGLDSHLEIFCTRNKPIAFVWTLKRHNTSSIIAISAKGQKKVIGTFNDTFDVLLDGTITFSKTSYQLEGIYTCTYLESNTSFFRRVQIKIGNNVTGMNIHKTVAWTTPVIIVVLITAIVGGLVSTTFYIHQNMWIHFVPSTVDGTLTCCEKIAKYVLSWPLYNIKNDFVFNKDGIELLRTVSYEIENNTHNKNVGVISGASVAMAGVGLLSVTSASSSILMGLGAVIGASGAAITVGSSVRQMMNQRNRRKVQPDLESFLKFQKDLAVTINNLAIVFNVIIKKRELKELCKQTAVSRFVITQLGEIFERLKAGHHNCLLNEKLTLASECTTEMLQILEKGITNTQFEETISLQREKLAEQIRKAQEHSFENLPCSIKTVVKTTMRERGKPTVLTLVITSFADSSERNGDVKYASFRQRIESTTALAEIGVDGAITLASRGVLVGNRLILKTLDLSDDAIRLTTNVRKMAKAVTVAGIILSTVGVVVDVSFLGHAAYDQLKEEKGESAKALSDIANVMEEINHLSNRKSKIVSKKL